MPANEHPHDPKAPHKRRKHSAGSPSGGDFRAPHPDRDAHPDRTAHTDHEGHQGQHDRWKWLERFDRDLADALEDSQYEVDGSVPDWPGRYTDGGDEE
jgi:hypothetical protein